MMKQISGILLCAVSCPWGMKTDTSPSLIMKPDTVHFLFLWNHPLTLGMSWDDTELSHVSLTWDTEGNDWQSFPSATIIFKISSWEEEQYLLGMKLSPDYTYELQLLIPPVSNGEKRFSTPGLFSFLINRTRRGQEGSSQRWMDNWATCPWLITESGLWIPPGQESCFLCYALLLPSSPWLISAELRQAYLGNNGQYDTI